MERIIGADVTSRNHIIGLPVCLFLKRDYLLSRCLLTVRPINQLMNVDIVDIDTDKQIIVDLKVVYCRIDHIDKQIRTKATVCWPRPWCRMKVPFQKPF